MPRSQPAHKFGVIFPIALRGDPAAAAAFERLLKGGCTEKNLVQLAEQEYLLETGQNDVFAKRRQELDWLTYQLGSWASRLRKIADEIDDLGRTRIKIEGNETVAEAIFNISREKPLRDRSFEEGSDSAVLPAESHKLRATAADFDGLIDAESWRHSARRVTDSYYTVIFWHYCYQAMLKKDIKSQLYQDAAIILAKAHEVAGSPPPEDPEAWLKKRLKRFQ